MATPDVDLAISTLGCPDWDLDRICRTCADWGYDGVDFRGYLDEPRDVTDHALFRDRPSGVCDRLAEAGLAISCLSSSLRICDESALDANLAMAEQFAALARALDVEFVRVFGAGDIDRHDRAELVTFGAETMAKLLEVPGASEVTWILETHDNWIDSRDCLELIEAVDEPNFQLLWDAGHTTRVGDEAPAETLDRVGEHIEYVHLKDARLEPDHSDAMDDGWRYVTPGEGELPLDVAVAGLAEIGYDGWLMFEHEKRWHPELAAPAAAFPVFIEWFNSLE